MPEKQFFSVAGWKAKGLCPTARSAQCGLTPCEGNEQFIRIPMPGEGLAPLPCERNQKAGTELTLGLGGWRSGLQHPACSHCPAETRSKKIGFCYR